MIDKRTEIKEIRRENLLRLIEEYGSVTKLNVALGRKRNDSSLAQIKSSAQGKTDKPTRSMGNSLARTIEQSLELPCYWMDNRHDTEKTIPRPNGTASHFDGYSGNETAMQAQALTIPLVEIRQHNQDLKCVTEQVGNIEIPASFATKLHPQAGDGQVFAIVMNDNSMAPEAPIGSIIVFDCSVRHYIKDGIYLLALNGNVTIRKIVSSIEGGYFVSSKISGTERAACLSEMKILGFALAVWTQLVL